MNRRQDSRKARRGPGPGGPTRGRSGPADTAYPGRPGGGLRAALALATLVPALAGCDLPLDPPEWSTLWSLVGTADTVSTENLLPASVREGGTGFVLEPVQAFRSVRLGDVCELCTCFDGPVPPLDLTPQVFPVPLPGGTTRAELVRGRIRAVLRNRLPFDLLVDDRGREGFLLVELLNTREGVVLDSVRIAEPLPPGDSVEVIFDLAGLELSRDLSVRIGGATPGSGCDAVELDPDDRIEADVVLEEMEAREVTVLVADAALGFDAQEIDLPDFVSRRLRPEDARVVLELDMDSNVELESEVLLSVGDDPERLFTGESALFTPIPVAPGSRASPTTIRKRFVLDLTRIQDSENIFIDTRSRIVGNRALTVSGGEAVTYTARLLVDLPSR